MQRYKVDLTGDEPIFHGLSADDNGPLVYFSEAQARISELEVALRMAEENLTGWCDAIDNNGTGWDDWDEWFKDAKYERNGKPSVLSVIHSALEKQP